MGRVYLHREGGSGEERATRRCDQPRFFQRHVSYKAHTYSKSEQGDFSQTAPCRALNFRVSWNNPMFCPLFLMKEKVSRVSRRFAVKRECHSFTSLPALSINGLCSNNDYSFSLLPKSCWIVLYSFVVFLLFGNDNRKFFFIDDSVVLLQTRIRSPTFHDRIKSRENFFLFFGE